MVNLKISPNASGSILASLVKTFSKNRFPVIVLTPKKTERVVVIKAIEAPYGFNEAHSPAETREGSSYFVYSHVAETNRFNLSIFFQL